jgi:signal transduction histidine kinase
VSIERPARADLLLAGVLLVFAVVSVLTRSPDEGPGAVTVPTAVVMTAALAWRRSASVTAVCAGVLAMLTQTLLAEPAGSLWAFTAMLVLTYSVAAERDEGRAAVGGSVMLAGQFVTEHVDGGVDYVFIAIVFGGAWLVGRAVRQWRGRAAHAEDHRHELALLAVAEERVRVSRELHDVVAHALSIIAVQADAAEAALLHDPTRAAEPLRAIRSSAREALDDMRQMLALLRSEEADSLAPVRALPDLAALVESTRTAGLLVDAQLPDETALGRDTVDPAVGTTCYRVVQEALTNALRYADGPVRLDVALASRVVRICVVNTVATEPRTASGTGRGLIGLAERVRNAGGSFSAGVEGDRFALRAELPCRVRTGVAGVRS